MKLTFKSSRGIALLTGAAVLGSTVLTPSPAHADKSKTWKIGAIALGAIAAYKLSKGDNATAAAAGAGAYYAYKKSRDAENDRYGYDYDRYPDEYYGGGGYYDPGYYPNDNGYYGDDYGYGRRGGSDRSGRYGRRDDNRYPDSRYLAPQGEKELNPVVR